MSALLRRDRARPLLECDRAAIGMAVPQAEEISVELVWDPPWSPDMMSEGARGFFGWSQP